MIDKTPIEGLDLNKTEAKTQINNFWNYLDELASKNPEEYKKFIKAQMEKGLSMAESIKKEKEQSNIETDIYSKNILTKKEFKVFPFMCLEFRPIKIIKQNFDKEIIDNNNIKEKNYQNIILSLYLKIINY